MRAASALHRSRAAKSRRHLLLASVSLVSLMAGTSAQAADILRSNVTAAPITASAASQAAAQQAALAAQRAQETLGRTTQALQAMQAAQSAAHAMALSIPSSIPNGLSAGGLQVVANPVVAAQDSTGLNTWQGADAPTQANDASGHANVTVKQKDSRAILSWQSFNVGKDTTLTYDQQGNKDWVALNRVVGADASPSQILGNIKADGTVLILNQNGIVFGGSSQVNVNSLIATSLEIGRIIDASTTPSTLRTIAQRNQEFLDLGLLGYGDSHSGSDIAFSPAGAQPTARAGVFDYQSSGNVKVENGAELTSGDGGYILLAAPVVTNSGELSATNGQVILAAADQLTLTRATGAADSVAPGIRGFLITPDNLNAGTQKLALNDVTGLITSPQGSILISAADGSGSATINQGGIFSTTSVSRNGAIEISGSNIEIAPGSFIGITPDDNGQTIPQDPVSLANFKPSEVTIGNLNLRSVAQQADQSALINVGSNALIYAPSGNITLGATAGPTTGLGSSETSRVFIESGAIIDASGLKNVLIPASRNQIKIAPLKNNELADDPAYKNSFLNGATVYVDPRLSGVRDDGVAWIGSPLIDAASYAQQVGATASELMTKGGQVTLGTQSYGGGGAATSAPDVTIKAGATIDISGGWVTYQAGKIQTTQLITSDGHIVDIGKADPGDVYIGIYNGYAVAHSRWGVTETYASPLGAGETYSPSYTEGRDAGSLTIKTSAMELDGSVDAQAFPGERQILDAQSATGKSDINGDSRAVQAAPSQLPSGGFLFVQAEATDAANSSLFRGGADILIQSASDYQKLPDAFGYGQQIQVASSGAITIPARDPASFLSQAQLGTIEISDAFLSAGGFGQVTLNTSGAITVAQNAQVDLAPGAIFDALAGRKITIDGSVSSPSGNITLATFDSRFISPGGSVFATTPAGTGDFDIVINGTLSARGRWVNDAGLHAADIDGSAWLNGGAISLYAAPDVSTGFKASGNAPATSTDLSGSILINSGSMIDVSGGGRIDQNGKMNLTAKGGNLSLYDETAYFQIASAANNGFQGSLSGLRVNGLFFTTSAGNSAYVPINPDQINSHVRIASGTILAQGFAGGGTFTLTTPELVFGSETSTTATILPLDFFSNTGFGSYNITSYKTDLISNPFSNGLGGTDALLATQTLTVGSGQVLSLTQSMLPNVLDAAQSGALEGLKSGGDLFSVVRPGVPVNAWDRKPVNLSLSGLLELHVASGGEIVGEAGATLTADKILNEGIIRLPGGTIAQRDVLPALYARGGALGIHALSDVFSVNPDGSIDEGAASQISGYTNAQLAGAGTANIDTPVPLYMLGMLSADEGIVLAPGSITDLSGVSIRNPYATEGQNGRLIATGRILAGGTLSAAPSTAVNGAAIFQQELLSPYQLLAANTSTSNGITTTPLQVEQVGRKVILDSGATLDLSGAADVYDEPDSGNATSFTGAGYSSTSVWSDAGSLTASGGATLTGATIIAHGGSFQAEGGTLTLLDPIISQHDPVAATANVVSADMISAADFTTLVALGSVSNSGDAVVDLGRAFFLADRPFVADGAAVGTLKPGQLVPTVRSGGGNLTINAPYVKSTSIFDTIASPAIGAPGQGMVVFNADAIDVAGSLLIDQSVSSVSFRASGDMRLTGVAPWQQTLIPGTAATNTLNGLIAASGEVQFNIGQLYPTTGSSFAITTAGAGATINFSRSGTQLPDAPYSASGDLLIQAANIVQGGVIRVPLGTLTLGGDSPYSVSGQAFAPATDKLTLADGGITSVSANALVVPYGTTTDQKEWYFAPTGAAPLTAPPSKQLSLSGTSIDISDGTVVDISGGGDVYAYEFVPGTGGSRDVLDQLNPDAFTSANGYQYPDGRQIYAIVPGLSNARVAAYDPLYSKGYENLASASDAGKQVFLTGGNGLAAGWYTLLPAKYALLPGGMRVVEETGFANPAANISSKLPDGSLVVSGSYGDALSGSLDSGVRLFNVQSQSVIARESNIALATGNDYFAALAVHNGDISPRLPSDAGHLVINPGASLVVNAPILTATPQGGRGAQIDISGDDIAILASLPDVLPADGTIRVTATSLSNLHADSLLVGGSRNDNADGSTTLDVKASSVLVQNDASTPLSAAEILLAANSRVQVDDGAAITAVGTMSDDRDEVFTIGSSTLPGNGALLRVANGQERLVNRVGATGGTLQVGAATLSGNAIMFDSAGANVLASGLDLQNFHYVAIAAPRIGFGVDASAYNGLVITDTLKSLLGEDGAQLTLRSQSSIDFADGTYNFGNVRFDAGSLAALGSGEVIIAGDVVSLGNAGTIGAECVACGGTLSITANQIAFVGGGMAAQFGSGINFTAQNGVFFEGGESLFDAGTAPVAIHTPFIGDRVRSTASKATASIPKLTLSSKGDIAIDDSGMEAVASPASGVPGSSLVINANALSVSGAQLGATAGVLKLTALTDIALSNGAMISAPSYLATFGDSADPVQQASPGGVVILTAQSGNIALGDANISVGGSGDAGSLSLVAPRGTIDFGAAVLDGASDTGGTGGSFSLVSANAVDLVALNNRLGAKGFTGGFSVQTSSGDLTLGADEILKSGAVDLVANGGTVDIAGSIDTSGANGGNVTLYGRSGVTLEGTAHIDASAAGYATGDTRQAKGGDVTIGTDFIASVTNADGSIGGTSGVINISNGAIIDVSAKHPQARLIPYYAGSTESYSYVAGDLGGVVTFRAPVIAPSGANTVDVHVADAGSVVGASAIDLVGFKRWDLAAVYNSGLYTGVTLSNGTINLDVSAGLDAATASGGQTTVAGLNFLGDKGTGGVQTLVDFIQNYDVSAAYGNLGGLATQANFHAMPGVDLAYDGGITLASNWNLGAGLVNVTAAKAAGLMGSETFVGAGGVSVTDDYIIPGNESKIFEDRNLGGYTTMLYRTGGSPRGEAPVISLQAGGDLQINGSVSDGFFQFRDQTTPDYLAAIIATSTKTLIFQVGANPLLGPTFNASASVSGTSTSTGASLPATLYVPYIAGGNSAAPPMVGDPFGSADLMPLLPGNAVASSSSFNFVAGADLSRSSTNVLQGGVGPLVVNPASNGNLSVAGDYTYSYGGSLVNVRYENTFNTSTAGVVTIANSSTSSTWESDVIAKALSVTSALAKSVFYGPNANQAILIGNDATAKKISREGSLIYVDLLLSSGQTIGGVPLTNDLTSVTLRDIAKISDPSDPKYDAYLHTLYMSSATSPTASNDFFTVASTSASILPDSSTAATQLHIIASVKTTAYIIQKYVDPYFAGASTGRSTATVDSLLRSGTGSIAIAAAGNVDLRNGAMPTYIADNGQATNVTNGYQLGGTAVYTAGHPAISTPVTVADPITGAMVTVDPAAGMQASTNFSSRPTYGYGNVLVGPSTQASGAINVLVADPVYAEGGGDISVAAGGDLLGRRDAALGAFIVQSNVGTSDPWIGSADEPWRSGAVGSATFARIDPQLFASGIGALAGGNIDVKAGGDISDLSVIATNSLATAQVIGASRAATALMTFGGGNVGMTAGDDILGGRVDIASGAGSIAALGNIAGAGALRIFTAAGFAATVDNLLRFHISDAAIAIEADGDISMQGVSALGPIQRGAVNNTAVVLSNLNASGFYSRAASVSLLADGSIDVQNEDDSLLTPSSAVKVTGGNRQAVYPGTFTAASMTGDLALESGDAQSILLMPSATGQLQLLAGGNIAPAVIAMLDADPALLPGAFTSFNTSIDRVLSGAPLAFPSVLPSTPDAVRALQHNPSTPHADDANPVRIVAGGDIGSSDGGLVLSVPKQARIDAGQDIVNMMFFGQNLSPSDVTRIVAGRDITATNLLVQPRSYGSNGALLLGAAEPALLGNTFVLGGPGDFMLEAGRDLGPFLNSATVKSIGSSPLDPAPIETFGGGILSVGNEWNPWLPATGASVSVSFGDANGVNYDGLREAYLDPANFSAMPDYLFSQHNVTTTVGGHIQVDDVVTDRDQPLYAPLLIQWMQARAATALTAVYGTTAVNYDQAYAAFAALPQISQRDFLNQIYFTELKETADPASPSYLKYSRGYQAVNTLFPASYGYTQNDLTGGSNGANKRVETGDLDLRLATIQTARGGDITILGPGGNVIAGSTVRTTAQAALRTFGGKNLFSGLPLESSQNPPVSINEIPPGFEGVLTLRGGSISTFTDGDFLLNQSRLFTEQGGEIVMWSSNADLNAGQGPKTSANFPPVLVRVSSDLFSELDQTGATTGAGIASLQATPDTPPSPVYLIAPRGTVDFGDAGIRISGDLFVAAQTVANADNVQVGGHAFGVPAAPTVDTGALSAASNVAAASAQTAMATQPQNTNTDLPSIITVEVLGYGGDSGNDSVQDQKRN